MGGPQPTVKPFEINKRLVYVAWERVRANQGASGVDTVSITDFADREQDNLFKLWNRMSSGSYLPGPVRAVEIPKIMGPGSGCSGCRMWRTGSPRPQRRCCWRTSSSRSSTGTVTATGRGALPWTRWL